MRLSEIKGEKTFDVLANLVEPVFNIAADDEASRLFRREETPNGMTPREFAAEKAKRCLPVLLRGHREDVVAIVSAIKMVDPDEYRKELSLFSLINDIAELMTDEDFLGFLSSSARTGDSSGSASESTEGQA